MNKKQNTKPKQKPALTIWQIIATFIVAILACGALIFMVSRIPKEVITSDVQPTTEAPTNLPVENPTTPPNSTQSAIEDSFSVLDGAYDNIPGIVEVLLTYYQDGIASAEFIVLDGYDTEETANAVRDATFLQVGRGDVEVSMILGQPPRGVSWTWDFRRQEWRSHTVNQ